MNMHYTISLLVVSLLSTLVVGCSSAPPKVDEQPVEQTLTSPPEPEETLTIPSFYNDDVSVKTVVSQGNTTEYQVGDLKVIHRSTPENDIVSVQLVIEGGTTNYPADKSGIEALALNVATSGGTKNTPREAFNTKLEQLGSSISAYARRDFSGYSFRSVKSAYSQTWDLFAEVVFQPAMTATEFEKQKEQQLAIISTRLDSPDSQVDFVASQLTFVNHPYSHLQAGFLETVSSITLDEVKAFQQQQLDASNMLLVVVGNIPKEELIAKVKDTFGKLKGSHTKRAPLPPISSQANSHVIAKRDLPTHYIYALAPAPDPKSDDFYPFILANAYTSYRFFEEIRTKRNLTYAVQAGTGINRTSTGFLYVTAVKPEETLRAMYDVIHQVKTTPMTQEELTGTLNTYITQIYMALETNASQASLLAGRQILMGDWREADLIVEKLQKVTAEQVQQAAQKYMQGYRFAVVGPTESFPDGLFQVTTETTKEQPSN